MRLQVIDSMHFSDEDAWGLWTGGLHVLYCTYMHTIHYLYNAYAVLGPSCGLLLLCYTPYTAGRLRSSKRKLPFVVTRPISMQGASEVVFLPSLPAETISGGVQKKRTTHPVRSPLCPLSLDGGWVGVPVVRSTYSVPKSRPHCNQPFTLAPLSVFFGVRPFPRRKKVGMEPIFPRTPLPNTWCREYTAHLC